MVDYFNTKIIELFGLPKTGKTTTITALKKHLSSSGKSVALVKERASVSPMKDKLHPAFNYWTAIAFMKEYIEANENSVDILLADRAILDAYVWVNFLSKRVKDDKYMSLFRRIVDQDLILNNYLAAFYFKASPEVVLSREQVRNIGKYSGRIVNPEIISAYSHSYQLVHEELLKISPITEIDTTTTGIAEVLEHVSLTVESLIVNTKKRNSSPAVSGATGITP